MKGISGTLVTIGVMSALAAGPAAADKPQIKQSPVPSGVSKVFAREHAVYRESAPGDAYFGRLKLSFLGIDNAFKDASVRAGDHTTDPDVINKLKDADESLQAWLKRYPHDPQLARSYFLAAEAHKKVWTKEYQDKAWRYMHLLMDEFPQTYFGKQVKKDVAVGFTEHYYAEGVPCVPERPSAAASSQPEPTSTLVSKRAPKATPAPSAAPTPQTTEAPSPAPAPATLKAAPGQPKVELVAPPCAQPSSPAADSTVAPGSLHSANPSSAPIPAGGGTRKATPAP